MSTFQVWRIIHRPDGRTLLVTNGLSDFFVDRVDPSVGFGLELALATDELLGRVLPGAASAVVRPSGRFVRNAGRGMLLLY